MAGRKNRYVLIIEYIFDRNYNDGATKVLFGREQVDEAANKLNIIRVKNIGDLIYYFRYRSPLPESIVAKAPNGYEWIIRGYGKSQYGFALCPEVRIVPNLLLTKIKIPDATPGVVSKYALSDEQALLAKIRYNRLIDIFTGVTCYSLQNHLRTHVRRVGQVETDEIYVGMNKCGVHYIFPVQAKGKKEHVGRIQVEQDLVICREKFPSTIGRPIAAQFMEDEVIALFEFEESEDSISIVSEKHYKLVRPEDLSQEELENYKKHSS